MDERLSLSNESHDAGVARDAGSQGFAGRVAVAVSAAGRERPHDCAGFFIYYRRSIMNRLVMSARNFLREEDGVTAIEYGLLAALVAVVISAGAAALGVNLNALFQAVANCLAPAGLPGACSL